jgi:hypothetical protein
MCIACPSMTIAAHLTVITNACSTLIIYECCASINDGIPTVIIVAHLVVIAVACSVAIVDACFTLMNDSSYASSNNRSCAFNSNWEL